MTKKITKSNKEWETELTSEQYRVTREAGTEMAFTGSYHDHKGNGIYQCVCCGEPLFASATKYDSGSGWPSFWQPLEGHEPEELKDINHGMTRTEVRCSVCAAHLGHVFEDGPQPTGLRYCINSASLNFKDKK